ncbi:hypothetical protein FK529_04715 [Tsukamurella asaccharolytica]|uniref:Glycerophosphoryl diester phosphodiesterase membrane domain-containing protein n=1 Tax=Tsukamurella asaccharolytica TaxID=2592067 RepID=A0A5C5RDC8_9ACTN|nr:hypothetical protein [Tsukamurella asaccharolytica]TWS20648.1 hypothetical protein FK529_04715 [Tsukamurella asaccharolytica]
MLLTTIAALGLLARLPLIDDSRSTAVADRDVRQILELIGLYPAGTVLVTLTWVVVSVAVAALCTVVTYRHSGGDRTSLRVAWRQARPRLPAALGLGGLNAVVILTPIVVAVATAIALAVRAGPDGARLTSTALLGCAALIVIALLPALALSGPMLVIEGLKPVDALWRAVALQRRGYGRLLGRVVCTYLLVIVVSMVANLPFILTARPEGDEGMQTFLRLALANGGWVIGQLTVLPFLFVTNAQLYADQMVRSEGVENLVHSVQLENE